MNASIRGFRTEDTPAVNSLAIAAFEQYRYDYSDWPAFCAGLKNTSALANDGELIVAEAGGRLVGGVAYIGPDGPRSALFERQWAIMRMLMVLPEARGRGIGRILAEACIARARRDGATRLALHTAAIMVVARPMYERMGFEWLRDGPEIFGVPYGIFAMQLDRQAKQ